MLGRASRLTGSIKPLFATKAPSERIARRFFCDAELWAKSRTEKRSYDLCEKKSRFICDIATLARSESFMLEQIDTSTATFAIGTTDLNFSLCMNKWGDDECYSVDSLRVDDCFSKSKNVFAITHIFSRSNDEKKYTEAHFCEQKASPLPALIKEALSPELISKIESESQTTN